MSKAAEQNSPPVWWIPPALALCWGLNWPAVKIMLGAWPPFWLRCVAFGLAAGLLILVLLWRRAPLLPARRDVPAVLISGLLNIAAFGICTAFAQIHTSTSRATVLTYTMPMMTVLLAWALLGERITRRSAWALLLGAGGIGLLAWPALQLALTSSAGSPVSAAGLPGTQSPMLGLLMPLLAASAWALGTVVLKRRALQAEPVCSLAWQLLVGSVLCGACALLAGERLPQQLSGTVWLAFVFHVLLATVLAYLLWFRLLKQAGAGVASMTTLFVPVVGVLGAMALVGEQPSALDTLGFVLVLSAAATVVLRPQPPALASGRHVPNMPGSDRLP